MRTPRADAAGGAGRGPYKTEQTAAIRAIESKRQELRVSLETLAERAGISWRQLLRIRKTGRAWRREINALRMALRSIEKDRKSEAALFGGAVGGDTGDGDEVAGQGGAGRA